MVLQLLMTMCTSSFFIHKKWYEQLTTKGGPEIEHQRIIQPFESAAELISNIYESFIRDINLPQDFHFL
ncbi:13632_t:CDS:2 [Ambispora leptoticha]|uniref:13632_t:CDS:1 n=1 Tax=Ambispora leptoticha TaxID=144679 RepID=A0A9N9ABH4_9GLOM|nr:13632_t:CDS:2 [Ambispora leptoticha]